MDPDGLLEEQLSAEFGEGVMSRSTPKTSPMILPRQSGAKSLSQSPPKGMDPASLYYRMAASSGTSDMAASSPGLSDLAASSGTSDMAALLGESLCTLCLLVCPCSHCFIVFPVV